MDRKFEEKITVVIAALEDAGYDPYAQLTEYIRTGDSRYITRKGNARRIVMGLEWRELRNFIENWGI